MFSRLRVPIVATSELRISSLSQRECGFPLNRSPVLALVVFLLAWQPGLSVFSHSMPLQAATCAVEEDPIAASFTLDHNQLLTMENRHTDGSVGKTKADFDEKFAKKKEIHLRQGRPFYGLFTVKNLTDKPLSLFYRVVKQINATAPALPADLEEMILNAREAKTIPVTLDPADVPVTSNNPGRLYLKLFADKDGKLEITLKAVSYTHLTLPTIYSV